MKPPQLAGPASGIGIVDSTKFAVNTLKVIAVLQGISEDLKAMAGGKALEQSTLRNLSAYLTLQVGRGGEGLLFCFSVWVGLCLGVSGRELAVCPISKPDPPPTPPPPRILSSAPSRQSAKDKFGFDSAKYGLTDAQSADIAAVFSGGRRFGGGCFPFTAVAFRHPTINQPTNPTQTRHLPEFDSNDDGRLELSEFRRLCDLVGRSLSDDEIREAIKLLGSRDSTHLYFNDFAGEGGGLGGWGGVEGGVE